MTFTTKALDVPVTVPAAYEQAAKAKLTADRKAFAAFRAVDQQQHEAAHRQRVTAAVALAEDELRLWRLDLEALEPEAAEALTGFRAAEDRARETREYARRLLAAYELVRGKGSAAEETDARIRADAADETSANAGGVMAQKQAELASADQALAETREGLAAAERQLEKAREAAGFPAGEAPISDVTVRANASFMQADEIWGSLSREDRQRVQRLARARDIMSDREWQAMMREMLQVGGGVA